MFSYLKKSALAIVMFTLCGPYPAVAHFGMVIPSDTLGILRVSIVAVVAGCIAPSLQPISAGVRDRRRGPGARGRENGAADDRGWVLLLRDGCA